MSRLPRKAEVACPTCGAKVVWNADSHWRPFCSERCRMIDLGAWFGEEHRISGPEGEMPHQPPKPGDESH